MPWAQDSCAVKDVPISSIVNCFTTTRSRTNGLIRNSAQFPPSSCRRTTSFEHSAAVQFVNYNNGNGETTNSRGSLTRVRARMAKIWEPISRTGCRTAGVHSFVLFHSKGPRLLRDLFSFRVFSFPARACSTLMWSQLRTQPGGRLRIAWRFGRKVGRRASPERR